MNNMGTDKMKEHGFLFKAEMVRAIRRDIDPKTMTRRPITFHNSTTGGIVKRKDWHELDWDIAQKCQGLLTHLPYWLVPFRDIMIRVYPRVKPGDRLWVRETWTEGRPQVDLEGHVGPTWTSSNGKKGRILYRATVHKTAESYFNYKWKPSIHMPRWASRIDLDVLAMRSQRIQDISADDAKAEGVPGGAPYNDVRAMTAIYSNIDPEIEAFHLLWDTINLGRGYGWDTNHPVWVYEFKKVL